MYNDYIINKLPLPFYYLLLQLTEVQTGLLLVFLGTWKIYLQMFNTISDKHWNQFNSFLVPRMNIKMLHRNNNKNYQQSALEHQKRQIQTVIFIYITGFTILLLLLFWINYIISHMN